MTLLKYASIGAVALMAAMSAGKANAFGDCHGECYTKVRSAAKYGYTERHVMMKPGYIERRSTPAVYGYHRRKVLVSSAKTEWVTEPGYSHTVYDTVLIRPAQTTWVMKTDWRGREVRCRVHVPAKYKSVARTVWTKGRKVKIHKPAQYSYVVDRVLVKKARSQHIYRQPEYGIVRERVLVSHGEDVWVKSY